MTYNNKGDVEEEELEAVTDSDLLSMMATPDAKYQNESDNRHRDKIMEDKQDGCEGKEEDKMAIDSNEEASTNLWLVNGYSKGSSIEQEGESNTAEDAALGYSICHTCSLLFISKVDLDEHMLTHTNGNQAAHVCQSCGEVFTTASRLQNHFQDCPEKDLSLPYTEHSNEAIKDERLFAPSINVGPSKSANVGRRQKFSKNSQQRFACYECGKSFAYNSSLRIHMRDHTDERPYVCKICLMAFKRRGALTLHVSNHFGDRPYGCDICGKTFTLPGNLAVHKRLHTDVRPYACDVCGKAFKQAVCLKVHLRTHTGVKPYKCEICGRGFTQKGSLNIHVRVHTGERPYRCEACGDSFKRMGHLKIHQRLHNSDRGD